MNLTSEYNSMSTRDQILSHVIPATGMPVAIKLNRQMRREWRKFWRTHIDGFDWFVIGAISTMAIGGTASVALTGGHETAATMMTAYLIALGLGTLGINHSIAQVATPEKFGEFLQKLQAADQKNIDNIQNTLSEIRSYQSYKLPCMGEQPEKSKRRAGRKLSRLDKKMSARETFMRAVKHMTAHDMRTA